MKACMFASPDAFRFAQAIYMTMFSLKSEASLQFYGLTEGTGKYFFEDATQIASHVQQADAS